MSNLFLLQNYEVLDLFEIKISDYEGYFRFHGSKNFNKDIVFKGQTYIYIPSEISNLEYSSDGKQNRPTLIIANINNFITNFIKDRNDFLGKRFYRKKILAKDLDDVNFGGANKNPLGVNNFISYISVDTYVVHKKNYETKEKVEFSLANILDLDGLTAPKRKVYNDACQWQYRGCGCNYGKINGYDGPVVEDGKADYTNLLAIKSDNLRIWLRPENQTFSGTIEVRNTAEPSKVLTFSKLSTWNNDAAASLAQSSFSFTGSPKKYENSGRMNNKNGILFHPTNLDALLISDNYTGKNCTIFYVSEMSTKISVSGLSRRGLTTQDSGSDNIQIGYHWSYIDGIPKEDSFSVASGAGWVLSPETKGITTKYNTPRSYCGVLPNNQTDYVKFFRDGNLLGQYNGKAIDQPNNLGINIWDSTERSEIVLYELIVFEAILDDETVKKISMYLANKYKLPIGYYIQGTKYKKSSEYFSAAEGNLGIPMADENNKLFLKYESPNSALTNYQTYGVEKLTYRGEYNQSTQYSWGDFVKIDPLVDYDFNEKMIAKNYEMPFRFFVCVDKNGSIGKNPLSYTNIWVEDKCSRNLNGCSLRFNDPIVNTPFGAFPGTVGYDYRLPG